MIVPCISGRCRYSLSHRGEGKGEGVTWICSIIGLEFYALLLAWAQSLGGVRTDEAKTLLNIPYPHPPLLRWIVSQTEALPFQEMLWRVLLASIVVQAVWLVWDMGRDLPRGVRIAAAASWLLSAAVIQQAGSITTAPVTAIWGLVFCWFLCRSELVEERYVGTNVSMLRRAQHDTFIIAFLWLLSLFTAYQAVLYLPIVVAALRRRQVSWDHVAFLVCSPLFLVGLYALSNPLSLDRFVDAGTLNVGKTLFQKLSDVGRTAMVGGSIVGVVMGLWGIMRKRAWPLALSILLVAAFIFLSLRSYYAVFFAPLFTGGVLLLLREHRACWKQIGIAYLLALFFLRPFPPEMAPSPARLVMQRLMREGIEGVVLISGSFGHEWQYESRLPIRKYRPELLKGAGAVVCLTTCDGLSDSWQKLEGIPVDVWVR